MYHLIKAELLRSFKKATSKLILLDYDGTLVDFTSVPEEARPGKTILNILNKLISKPGTKIVIITGRSYQDIDKLIGQLPIDIIAEHGAMTKSDGEWKKHAKSSALWKNEVLAIVNEVWKACPESMIEEKLFSISWHYRNAETGYINSRKLIGLLGNIIESSKLKLLDGNQIVEIMSGEIGKGKAVKNLLEHNRFDFILSVGDDKTDEEMFETLLHNTSANTIKVGEGETCAKYKFDKVDNVIELLKELSV
jgi:trehalose 6-phosphate synthase/phosphatase